MPSEFSINDKVCKIPYHFNIRAFNLKTHIFEWIRAEEITEYIYNKNIENKLVLPQSHKDLIDILLN